LATDATLISLPYHPSLNTVEYKAENGVGTVVADGSLKVQYRVSSLIELETLFMLLSTGDTVATRR